MEKVEDTLNHLRSWEYYPQVKYWGIRIGIVIVCVVVLIGLVAGINALREAELNRQADEAPQKVEELAVLCAPNQTGKSPATMRAMQAITDTLSSWKSSTAGLGHRVAGITPYDPFSRIATDCANINNLKRSAASENERNVRLKARTDAINQINDINRAIEEVDRPRQVAAGALTDTRNAESRLQEARRQYKQGLFYGAISLISADDKITDADGAIRKAWDALAAGNWSEAARQAGIGYDYADDAFYLASTATPTPTKTPIPSDTPIPSRTPTPGSDDLDVETPTPGSDIFDFEEEDWETPTPGSIDLEFEDDFETPTPGSDDL